MESCRLMADGHCYTEPRSHPACLFGNNYACLRITAPCPPSPAARKRWSAGQAVHGRRHDARAAQLLRRGPQCPRANSSPTSSRCRRSPRSTLSSATPSCAASARSARPWRSASGRCSSRPRRLLEETAPDGASQGDPGLGFGPEPGFLPGLFPLPVQVRAALPGHARWASPSRCSRAASPFNLTDGVIRMAIFLGLPVPDLALEGYPARLRIPWRRAQAWSSTSNPASR